MSGLHPGPRGTVPDEDALAARLASLEADRWRTLEDAQRDADTMFAQYQLSQLLASGSNLSTLLTAVLDELLRHSEAAAGALWLAAQGETQLSLAAAANEPIRDGSADAIPPARPPAVPVRFVDARAATRWCRDHGWHGVALEESRDLGEGGFEQRTVGFVALKAARERPLSPDHARFLALVRHELAIAFRAAQLREALARERALLSAILDGASEAIIAVDAERRVVRLNQAAVALLGVSAAGGRTASCGDLLGCLREPAADADSSAELLRCGPHCPFEEVLGGGEPIVDREHTIIGRDEVEVPVAGSYARMSGPDPGAVAVLRDLRAAHALDELRSSFVAAVSHELRTPLALISGYVDSLLGLDLDSESRRHSVERIGQAAGRLTALVNSILDVAHIESDRLDLKRTPTTIESIAARVTGEWAEAPGMPPIDLAIPPDLPPVDADPARVGQVLGNLIANAVKYGGPQARIRIGARLDEAMVVVSVEDDGDGIDGDERAHVFERFYRGRRGRQSGTPGSGLGLYLCQRLVEAHGGRIWLDDRPRGTSISFTLPVATTPGGRTSQGDSA